MCVREQEEKSRAECVRAKKEADRSLPLGSRFTAAVNISSGHSSLISALFIVFYLSKLVSYSVLLNVNHSFKSAVS